MNPYESAFDIGNISIDGDATPCQKLPVQSPRNNVTELEVVPVPLMPPPVAANLQPSQSQLPPPRSMNELYKRRFRRPYITEEGYNLDDYREEKVPLPKDPRYLATKKDILKHRDMIRDKFSTMQSANNITHMLYFEQSLDSKRTISTTYPYDKKKEMQPMKKKEETKRLRTESFKEILQAKQQAETLKASTSGQKTKVRNTSLFDNSIFASIFEVISSFILFLF